MCTRLNIIENDIRHLTYCSLKLRSQFLKFCQHCFLLSVILCLSFASWPDSNSVFGGGGGAAGDRDRGGGRRPSQSNFPENSCTQARQLAERAGIGTEIF